MSIGTRVALAAVGTIGAAAVLGAAVSARTGSVPAVAVVAPDTVASASPAVNMASVYSASGWTVTPASTCPHGLPPTKPGIHPVTYCPSQGSGGTVEGPGGNGGGKGYTGGPGGVIPGGDGPNSCTNIDILCHSQK
jgi:hypothetical protein